MLIALMACEPTSGVGWVGLGGWVNHAGVLFMLWVMLRAMCNKVSEPCVFRAPSKHARNIGRVTKPCVSHTFAKEKGRKKKRDV